MHRTDLALSTNAVPLFPPPPLTAERPRRIAPRDLLALTKPRITISVLITTAGGLWLAPGQMPLSQVLLALLGTTLIIGSANAVNMYLEREIDGRVPRTRSRPLPSGRLAPAVALWFGAILGLLAIPILALGVNLLTGFLGLLAFLIYTAVYTPLKQHSPLALVVGAVPGAIPPLMGWTAARGKLELPGLVLFAILFLWQIPHFLAISLYRVQEMSRAGYKVLVAQRGVRAAKVRIVLYLAALWPVSLLLVPLHIAGTPYLVTAGIGGAIFFGWGVYGLRESAQGRWARGLFQVSLVYQLLLMLALGMSRALPVG